MMRACAMKHGWRPSWLLRFDHWSDQRHPHSIDQLSLVILSTPPEADGLRAEGQCGPPGCRGGVRGFCVLWCVFEGKAPFGAEDMLAVVWLWPAPVILKLWSSLW